MVKVPFLDLKRRNSALKEVFKSSFGKVLSSTSFIQGPAVKQFEQELSDYLGATVLSCASGSDALLLTAMALNIGPQDEVIVPAFTFVATAGAPARLGARVRFADVNPRTYNIDVQSVKEKINDKTRAIIAVDLFGNPACYQELKQLAQENQIELIEDAAQSLGGRYHDSFQGSLTSYGCLSFFPAKNLGCFGDGGAVVVQDPKHADQIRCLRQHGSLEKYTYSKIGINSRLDSVQAAVLSVQLPFLDEWVQKRLAHAFRYNLAFADLESRGFIFRPRTQPGGESSYNQYVIRVLNGERDALKNHLINAGIQVMIYYPHSLNTQSAFTHHNPEPCPQAESLCQEVLALPVSPWLTSQEQDIVVNEVCRFFDH